MIINICNLKLLYPCSRTKLIQGEKRVRSAHLSVKIIIILPKSVDISTNGAYLNDGSSLMPSLSFSINPLD
jgi:hypothetical protein